MKAELIYLPYFMVSIILELFIHIKQNDKRIMENEFESYFTKEAIVPENEFDQHF